MGNGAVSSTVTVIPFEETRQPLHVSTSVNAARSHNVTSCMQLHFFMYMHTVVVSCVCIVLPVHVLYIIILVSTLKTQIKKIKCTAAFR